jgi:hypothetical protein
MSRGVDPKMRILIPANLADAAAAQTRNEGISPTRWVANLIEDRLAEVRQEEPDAEVCEPPSPLDIFPR